MPPLLGGVLGETSLRLISRSVGGASASNRITEEAACWSERAAETRLAERSRALGDGNADTQRQSQELSRARAAQDKAAAMAARGGADGGGGPLVGAAAVAAARSSAAKRGASRLRPRLAALGATASALSPAPRPAAAARLLRLAALLTVASSARGISAGARAASSP